MSKGFSILRAGNLEQHMQDDMIIPVYKNLENWGESGEPSITFSSGVNTVTYENNPKTPAQILKELLQTASGLPVADTAVTQLLDQWSQHDNLDMYYYADSSLSLEVWLCPSNSYIDNMTLHYYATSYRNMMASPGGASINSISSTTTQGNGTKTSNRILVKIGSYSVLTAGSYEGYITQNFTVEDAKKYYFTFEFYSSSGFTASSTNNIVLTSGNNSANVTLDESAGSDYKLYSGIIVSDGTTLNVKIDLPTMTSSSDIVLKFRNIELHKLGT